MHFERLNTHFYVGSLWLPPISPIKHWTCTNPTCTIAHRSKLVVRTPAEKLWMLHASFN